MDVLGSFIEECCIVGEGYAVQSTGLKRSALDLDSGRLLIRMMKTGHPAEEILKTADEEGVDMVLVGSRGRRGAGLFMMGSVSREVANAAQATVWRVE